MKTSSFFFTNTIKLVGFHQTIVKIEVSLQSTLLALSIRSVTPTDSSERGIRSTLHHATTFPGLCYTKKALAKFTVTLSRLWHLNPQLLLINTVPSNSAMNYH